MHSYLVVVHFEFEIKSLRLIKIMGLILPTGNAKEVHEKIG